MTVSELRELLYELDGDMPVFAESADGHAFVVGRVDRDLVPDPEFPTFPGNAVAAVVLFEEYDADI